MQKTIFRILIVVGIVGISLPFLVGGGMIGLFMVDDYKNEKRAEQAALERHYQVIYTGRDKVSLLSPPKPLPAIDGSPRAIVKISWNLAKGELTPSAQKRRLQIEAPLYAEREYKALLRAIASSCVMTATAVSGSSSQLYLRMDLKFSQKKDALRVASARRLDLTLVQVDYRDQHHSDSRASADDVYAQIASDCDKSIAAIGPCKFDRIYLNTSVAEQNGKAARVFTRGSANFFLVREEDGPAIQPAPPNNAHEPG